MQVVQWAHIEALNAAEIKLLSSYKALRLVKAAEVDADKDNGIN